MRFWLQKKGTRLYSPATRYRGEILVEDNLLCSRQEVRREYRDELIRGRYWEENGELQIELYRSKNRSKMRKLEIALCIITLLLIAASFFTFVEFTGIDFFPTPTVISLSPLIFPEPTPEGYKYFITVSTISREKIIREREYLCSGYQIEYREGYQEHGPVIHAFGCSWQPDILVIMNITKYSLQVLPK